MMNCKCASRSESRRIPSERVLVWRTLDGLNSFALNGLRKGKAERQKESLICRYTDGNESAIRSQAGQEVSAGGCSCEVHCIIWEPLGNTYREWKNLKLVWVTSKVGFGPKVTKMCGKKIPLANTCCMTFHIEESGASCLTFYISLPHFWKTFFTIIDHEFRFTVETLKWKHIDPLWQHVPPKKVPLT